MAFRYQGEGQSPVRWTEKGTQLHLCLCVQTGKLSFLFSVVIVILCCVHFCTFLMNWSWDFFDFFVATEQVSGKVILRMPLSYFAMTTLHAAATSPVHLISVRSGCLISA